jgi:hypothetical protein
MLVLVRRILRVFAALLAFALYVWYRAVREAPAIKRRKAARRRARRSQDPYVSEGSGPGTR